MYTDSVSGICQSRDGLQAEILYIPPKEDCVLLPLLFLSGPVSQEEKKKNLLPMLTLVFASGEKNPQARANLNSQGWAASPSKNSCPCLPPSLRVLHCTGIKLDSKKREVASQGKLLPSGSHPGFSSSSALVELIYPVLCPCCVN